MEQLLPPTDPEFQIIMSEDAAEAFFAACENPPEFPQKMRDQMKVVMQWLKD